MVSMLSHTIAECVKGCWQVCSLEEGLAAREDLIKTWEEDGWSQEKIKSNLEVQISVAMQRHSRFARLWQSACLLCFAQVAATMILIPLTNCHAVVNQLHTMYYSLSAAAALSLADRLISAFGIDRLFCTHCLIILMS